MKKAMLVPMFFLALNAASAADINWDELEKKAQQYTGEIEKKDNDSGSSSGSGKSKGVDLVLPGQPQGRTIDNAAPPLSEADKRHITVHLKLANRHFSKKNYPKAIEETDLVFEREPDNAGARFMRAVIAGRLRDHQAAWFNILIAREKDQANPKIDTFINKLKTVAPEPTEPVWVQGVYRSIPVSGCEKAADVIERLLLDPVSHNITSLQTGDFTEEADKTVMPVQLECSSPPDKDAIVSLLKKAAGGDVTIKSGEGNKLDLSVTIKGFGIENKNARPISDLQEFIKDLTEEVDVAISDTVEREAENKILDITYEISTRDFKTLNDFLRKISPYATRFRVQSLRLAYITGSQSIIWKCKVQVLYKVS